MQFDWNTFTYDDEWLREAVRIEAQVNGNVGAGRMDWGARLGDVVANPHSHIYAARLQSRLFAALAQLLAAWNLGIGLEGAQRCGQQCLLSRLHQPAPEIQAQLLTLLEAELTLPQAGPNSSISLDAMAMDTLLKTLLTPQDWEAIATAAGESVRTHVIHKVEAA